MFVWVFHRISGLLLILLLAFQLVTGFYQAAATDSEAAKVVAGLHRHALLNVLLVFLVIFHGAYGVRLLLIDLGCRRPRALFWGCTAAGTLLFAVFFVLYVGVVAR